jgi:hypothetical protein
MNNPIYALSGYAEWFWLMTKNWKDIENRSWSLNRYRKLFDLPVRVYLHASKTKASDKEINFICDRLSPDQFAEFRSVDWSKLRGNIIGEITFTEDVTVSDSIWFFGKHGFLTESGVLYDDPIPCRGQLGFFKPKIGEKSD